MARSEIELINRILLLIYRHEPKGIRRIEIIKTFAKQGLPHNEIEKLLIRLRGIGILLVDRNARYHINFRDKGVINKLEYLARKEGLKPPSQFDISFLIREIDKKCIRKVKHRLKDVRLRVVNINGELYAKIPERVRNMLKINEGDLIVINDGNLVRESKLSYSS